MSASSIAVSTGFTYTTAAVALLNVLVGGVLVAIVRAWPSLRKIANERERSLLEERAADMSTMRTELKELRAELDSERAAREAERAIDRHRINNLQACLDALLLMIETDPSKASAAASKIREMRKAQMETEAVEKATIQAARVKRGVE